MPAKFSPGHVHGRVIPVPPYGTPEIASTAWIAPGAAVVGNVTIGADSSIWYNSVVRGDSDAVRIGARTNIQDGSVVHTQAGDPAVIGDDVSVGHLAVIHGATIGNGCLVGMHATVLSGAVVGEGSLIAAGAVVPQGMWVPPHSLVVGVPGRVVRELGPEDRTAVRENAERYLVTSAHHRDATRDA